MISFGIITDGKNDDNLQKVIASIRAQGIPDYEICVCGSTQVDLTGITHLEFDETIMQNAICRKKNAITRATTGDVIVYVHDYVGFAPGWWDGMQAFGWDWDICVTRVLNLDGMRHWDWLCTSYRHAPHKPPVSNQQFLHYDDYSMMDQQYVPGNYWIAKRHVMEAEPLDENLRWAEMEDVEWSERVLPKYRYRMNPVAAVRYVKQK